MNKIITMYELLGLIKDKKAPKKVLINDKVYYLLVDEEHYVYSQYKDIRQWDFFIDNCINISQNLDLEVLVLEDNDNTEILEEEKKIPEKIDIRTDNTNREYIQGKYGKNYIKSSIEIAHIINEIIDYLKSKGE